MFYDYLHIKCLFRLTISIIYRNLHFVLVQGIIALDLNLNFHIQSISNQSENQFEPVALHAAGGSLSKENFAKS